ncbi:Peroxidase 57 [Linum perenne]
MVAKASMVLVVVFLLPLFVPLVAGLQVGFYRSTCPQAETIVRNLVQKRFGTDKSITAALLRMHFHDCFVRGCDASILIDSTPQKQSEKAAGPNQSVRGYDLIDSIKSALESACPSRVSCADVVALATRDAVALAGGPAYQLPTGRLGGPKYTLPTGRLDGLTSSAADVKLPGPTLSVYLAFTKFFKPMGFTLPEMVVLLGAHTVGSAHCSFFQDRVVNFMGTGQPDPSMDPTLVRKLVVKCGRGGGNATTFLDQGTSLSFDGSYYREVKAKRGVLLIDHELGNDPVTSGMVSRLGRDELRFKKRFGDAMVKMGKLVGSGKGEIRKNCREFN